MIVIRDPMNLAMIGLNIVATTGMIADMVSVTVGVINVTVKGLNGSWCGSSPI